MSQPLGAGRADDEPVTVSYGASSNVSFRGERVPLGVTWGEWREMSPSGRDALLDGFLYELVDLAVDEE